MGRRRMDAADEQRIAILLYYRKGRVCDPGHDGDIIRQLLDLGYLRSGITPELEETLRTTDDGLVYLRSYGMFVRGAPRVINGAMLARPLFMRRRRASSLSVHVRSTADSGPCSQVAGFDTCYVYSVEVTRRYMMYASNFTVGEPYTDW